MSLINTLIPESTDLDAPIRGAANIAKVANVLKDNGDPDMTAAFYKLEQGYIPASKEGRIWVSTLRRIRSIAAGEAPSVAPRKTQAAAGDRA